ncbi:MAG: MarR family winged helix-turn-helix transcriptional regulator [Acidimicrobiales bacterium]|jgi:DNA-binding MarR family transcriptional regulator
MPERRQLSFDPIAEAQRQWEVHEWTAQAPNMAVVTSVMRLQQIFLSRADAELRPFDLTFARYEVLMLLSFSTRGLLPLGKIGERLQLNPASVTNAVDRLESQGLVAKQRNPHDGRGTLATLTAAGRRVAQRATVVMNAQVFSDLGLEEPEVRTLFGILAKLRSAAGDFE